MLKFILRIVFFSLASLAAYLLALFVVSNMGEGSWHYIRKYTNIPAGAERRGGHSLLRFRDIQNFKNIDVLFIGSSHSYRGFDTRVLENRGITCFNMSTGAQTPLNTYYLLDRYKDQLAAKIIIFEVNPVVNSKDGTECLLDLHANTDLNRELFRMAIATRNIIAINGYLRNIFDIDYEPAKNLAPNLAKTDTYIAGGYIQSSRSDLAPYRTHKVTIENNKLQIKHLKKIFKLAHKHGSDLVLITVPMYKEFIQDMVNYEAWSEEMGDLAKKHGFSYYDYNHYNELTTADLFYDYQHLNTDGVEKFNEVFHDDLDEYIASIVSGKGNSETN